MCKTVSEFIHMLREGPHRQAPYKKGKLMNVATMCLCKTDEMCAYKEDI